MRNATKTRSFSFPDAIWRRFWSPRRAIRLSRALFLASRRALWDSPGAPGASRGRHETLPRHLLNALGRHGVPQKAPRIDFRSSAWRRPHRLTNSLISCEPADTVESPCGPAHTKQGCLSIRVACAYPNAHGRASSTRAPFQPSRRSSPHAIRACTAFEPARHARDVQNVWFCMARRTKKTALPTFPGLHRLLCLPCLPCLLRLSYLTWLSCLPCLSCPLRLPCLLRLPCHPCLPCLRCFSCPSCLPCLIPVPSASPLPALLAMLCLSCLPCPLYLMCLSCLSCLPCLFCRPCLLCTFCLLSLLACPDLPAFPSCPTCLSCLPRLPFLYCSSNILLALPTLSPSHPAHPACPAWPACPANPFCPSHEFCPIQDNLNRQRLPFQTILHDF